MQTMAGRTRQPVATTTGAHIDIFELHLIFLRYRERACKYSQQDNWQHNSLECTWRLYRSPAKCPLLEVKCQTLFICLQPPVKSAMMSLSVKCSSRLSRACRQNAGSCRRNRCKLNKNHSFAQSRDKKSAVGYTVCRREDGSISQSNKMVNEELF